MKAENTVMSKERIKKIIAIGKQIGEAHLIEEVIAEAQAEVSFPAGIREVVEGQKHIDGKVTGDLECFCMVKPDECDDPYNKNFPLSPMYPDSIAEGEGRLIFVPKAKLKEWGIK